MKSQSKLKTFIRNTGDHRYSRKGKKLFKRKEQTCMLFLTDNEKIASREKRKHKYLTNMSVCLKKKTQV